MAQPPPPNDAIAELAQGLGEEDARELVRMFLNGFELTLAALSSKDREDRRRAAHSLKSSSRIVGLLALSRQMAELEDRLAKDEGEVVPADVSAARQKFDEIAPVLRAFAGVPGS
ncbi:MAG TPA: Hpt domain-containing protein [Opitutaceae bacterium]|nr:Hpt domain-containing protein [Opitutaceae bacterium]